MKAKKKISKKKILLYILIAFFELWLIVAVYHQIKPMPENTSLEGEIYNISEENIEFLYDLTYYPSEDENAEKIVEQEIFEEVFKMVDEAEQFILIDMFLFNSDYPGKERLIPLATILKNKLIAKKQANPEIKINFITDEINNFYGVYTSSEIKELEENDINVIITDLTKLRDSNVIYSPIWRTYFQWFGTEKTPWLKHPIGNPERKVSLRGYLKLLNTKANHRKTIITDKDDKIYALVTSANPHDASSMHSNVAILVKEELWKDILKSETAVAEFSGYEIQKPDFGFVKETTNDEDDIQVQLLTEKQIKISLLKDIAEAEEGESVDIGMFYLSDGEILSSLIEASNRGVKVRLILDSNKDAFAREKNGIPNRQAAYDLVEKSKGKIQIRWYDTRGEQFHSKIIIIRKHSHTIVYAGSANLTRRNIDNLNLESDLKIIIPNEKALAIEFEDYFARIWNNEGGQYTLDFSKYEEPSKSKRLLFYIQEETGMSSF